MILDNAQYKTLCLNILKNESWYKPVPMTTFSDYVLEFYQLVDEAFSNQIISNTIFDFIRTPCTKVPTFYCLPKTHKKSGLLSARPIVSGVGNLTENASKLVDTVLRPHVLTLSSYIQDTGNFLRNIENPHVPPTSLLVTIDLENLYNSIPHAKGVTVVAGFLPQMEEDSRGLNDFIL